MAKPRPELNEAFKARYVPNDDGCWIWTGERDKNGYGLYVTSKTPIGNGKYKRIRERAHRLSWQLHRGEIPQDLEVCHSCDNTHCVNPDHLFVDTHKNNMADRDWKGRHSHGAAHYRAGLTEAIILEIRSSSLTLRELSERYGISEQSLSEARSGKTWKHVLMPNLPDGAYRKGSHHGMSKLHERDIPGIRLRWKNGESCASIANDFGVSDVMISRIVSGKNWAHVP